MTATAAGRPLPTGRPDRPALVVLRHHGLGDLVTAQPALRGLRRRFPDHRLWMTCPSWLLPLAALFGTVDRHVSELSPERQAIAAAVDPSRHRDVDEALMAAVPRVVDRADVVISLRTPGPELVALIAALQPALLVSYRYGPLPATHRFPELDFSDHILDRWARLLAEIDVELADSDIYVEMNPSPAACGFTVVHPGAGSPARLWPPDRWTSVVRHLVAQGSRVVLTGSREETNRVADIGSMAGLPPASIRCGIEVIALAELIAGARLVVCTDSGVSHLATAFRRPALTLFGPVPPAWWGPPPGNRQHRTIWTGRTGDNYADEPDPGLMEISAEMVVGMLDSMQAEGIWA